MDQIKAFVGHSFSDVDKPVVSAFLELFDQLKGLLPHFSWERAYAAEPKDLAEKVLGIIADKNTFIGICTKNEVVAPESAFKPTFFKPSLNNVPTASLKPKTSDWIIQEIGLAKGRGMEIVLLIEEGVREPGGLQGNVEYISFPRNNPQKAFGKILEMIHALSPTQATSPSASEPPSSGSNLEPPVSGGFDLTPKPDWTLEQYSRAAFEAIATEQEDTLASLSGAFLSSAHNTGSQAVAEWEGRIEFWKIVFGRHGSLDKLRNLASQHPNSDRLLMNLARGLARYGDHKEAAEMYLRAAACTSGEKAMTWRARAAVEFATAREFPKADALMDELRSAGADTSEVLSAIQEIAELRKDQDEQIAALERKVNLTPDDSKSRFSLAYKHSEIGNDDLALYHYLQVPADNRSAVGWNNLGVQYDHFKMPNNAVSAYRIAENMGETLSMSNLAFKLMRAGFLKESQEIFNRARQIEGYHKNVDTGLAQLKDVQENENETLNETLEKVHQKAEFYKTLGDAITKPKCVTLDGKWQGKETTLTSTLTEKTFRAVGTYEADAGLGSLVFGGFLQPSTKHVIEYDCELVGRMLEGTVKRKREGETGAGLLGGDGKTKVLMYVSEDGSTIEIMENPPSTYPTFHSLKAI